MGVGSEPKVNQKPANADGKQEGHTQVVTDQKAMETGQALDLAALGSLPAKSGSASPTGNSSFYS